MWEEEKEDKFTFAGLYFTAAFLSSFSNVSIVLGVLFLADLGMHLHEGMWPYIYSLDLARMQHCMATLYLYLLIYNTYLITCLSLLVLCACIVLCKLTIRVQSVDIVLLVWFFCVYYTTNSWRCWLALSQLVIIAIGLFSVWYCLWHQQMYRAWTALLICHITLAGPSLDVWTYCLFVLNKACLIAAADIVPVTILHIAVLLNIHLPEEKLYGVLNLNRLKHELELLPGLFQRVSLDVTLHFLQNKLDLYTTRALQQYLCKLNSPPLLSSLFLRNRLFLQNSLSTNPNFRFLLLLNRSRFGLLCWETNNPPLRILLRNTQGRWAALMSKFLQRLEEKLGLLWLREKEAGDKMGRLSRYLLLDIFEYI